MAIFTEIGIDDIAEMLKKAGELGNGEIVGKIQQARAEVYVEKWKSAIDKAIRNKKRSTGDMKNAVGIKKAKENIIHIYPLGKDRKGVSNAEKAYIHHYGRSNQKASRFVDAAEADAEMPALEAAQKIMDEFIEKI